MRAAGPDRENEPERGLLAVADRVGGGGLAVEAAVARDLVAVVSKRYPVPQRPPVSSSETAVSVGARSGDREAGSRA